MTKGETIYHIEDNIKLPNSPVDLNPKEVYLVVDKDKRNENEKFKNVKLFPTCYNGILSCEYYFKIIFEMDTWFSSNEEFNIPIDFYEPFIYMDNPNDKITNQQNLIYYNNEYNSQQIPQISPFEFQTSQQNYYNINNVNEYELPSEEEIQSQKKNDDGSAPPPSQI